MKNSDRLNYLFFKIYKIESLFFKKKEEYEVRFSQMKIRRRGKSARRAIGLALSVDLVKFGS